MKKQYNRPDIVFERFSMNSSIAGQCEFKAQFARDICGAELTEAITVFTDEIQNCSFKQPDGEYDMLCYHVPTDSYNVFNS